RLKACQPFGSAMAKLRLGCAHHEDISLSLHLPPVHRKCCTAEIANHWHGRLLRARRERPRGSRAAKKRDVHAPFHSITSSARCWRIQYYNVAKLLYDQAAGGK